MKRLICVALFSFSMVSMLSAKEYFVSAKSSSLGDGSKGAPFKTIAQAAKVAVAGDVITVGEGVYREWIDPANGGDSDANRIVYRAAPGEKVEIKGSEVVTGWKKQADGTWKVFLPDSFFNGTNSCKTALYGDWLWLDELKNPHTADLYINGNSLFEADSLCHVIQATRSPKAVDSLAATYRWTCVNDENGTTIYANFKEFDPNKALVELSVRPTCFYPSKQGINYITISGFDMSQAATQWGAPTAHQVGMIATHWNKGWIIENNRLHDTKSSAITLGKDATTGHNTWSAKPEKFGQTHYVEATLRAIEHGWNEENLGAHVVRNNEIFNCEQTGMCGSMGCAFSEIYNNHIYNIWVKRQFTGAEIAGIKFHAAIDTHLHDNYIHHCQRGIWLDWMTQGTRVSSNLLHDCVNEDLFVEVNHGPYIVDNNILLSPRAVTNQSQGGAYIQNLIAGDVYAWPELSRTTPYHFARSTRLKGLDVIVGGDDQFYNNLFLALGKDPNNQGLQIYNSTKFPHKPAVSSNVYCNNAKPYQEEAKYMGFRDKAYVVSLDFEKDGSVYLVATLPDCQAVGCEVIRSEMLGETFLSEEQFLSSAGESITFDTDYFGKKRSANPSAGALESAAVTRVKVWPKN